MNQYPPNRPLDSLVQFLAIIGLITILAVGIFLGLNVRDILAIGLIVGPLFIPLF